MDNLDIQFLKQIKDSCEKNNVGFLEMDFTISKLCEWILSWYHFSSIATARKRAILFSHQGFIVSTTKGFRFAEKALKVIQNE